MTYLQRISRQTVEPLINQIMKSRIHINVCNVCVGYDTCVSFRKEHLQDSISPFQYRQYDGSAEVCHCPLSSEYGVLGINGQISYFTCPDGRYAEKLSVEFHL